MICPRCHKEHPDNVIFCPYCGYTVKSADAGRTVLAEDAPPPVRDDRRPDHSAVSKTVSANDDVPPVRNDRRPGNNARNKTVSANDDVPPDRNERRPDNNARNKTVSANGAVPPSRPPQPPLNGFPPPPVPLPPQKSNSVLIAAIIAASVVVLAAAGILTFVLFRSNADKTPDTAPAASSGAAAITSAPAPDVRAADNKGSTQVQPVATPSNEVTLTNVSGKSLADAKSALEAQGLKVATEEETSESVAKGSVIRQIPAGGTTLTKGSTVTLYVSKGSAKNPDPYDQKLVVTAGAGSSYAQMVLYQWGNGQWEQLFSCSSTVGKEGINSNNYEYNTMTPKGAFPLGVVLTAASVNTGLDVYASDSNTVVCDDPSRPELYNQIGPRSKFGSAHIDPVGEKLTNGQNNALIFIQHNGSGFSSDNVDTGNSSVITICGCYDAIAPTNGCIDIRASDMNTLLSLLDKNKKPIIITEVQ